MRPTGLTLVAVAALSLASSAYAGQLYSYSFGPITNPTATGTFTTEAAPPTDPGYFLLTSFTLNSLTDTFVGPISPVNITVPSNGFVPGAAYNPTTEAFISHWRVAGPSPDTVPMTNFTTAQLGIFLVANMNMITDPNFVPTLFIEATYPSHQIIDLGTSGTLTITPQASPVPEPSSPQLMVAGAVGGLVYVLARERRAIRHKPPEG